MRPLKALTRVLAVAGKELREITRRPGAVLSLILGPLLVLGLFGLGFTGQRQPLESVIVVPPGSELPRDAATYQRVAGDLVAVAEVTDDVAAARARLDREEVRLVLILPADGQQRLERGEQATLEVETDEIDPVEWGAVLVIAETIAREMNAEIISAAARAGYASLRASVPEAAAMDPEVVARPLRATVANRAPAQPAVLTFFTPAVLALVLQHLAITLTALSMVRERLTGAIDIFRVSPVGAVEILVGKYAAYAVLSLVVSTIVLLIVTNAFGIPFYGEVGDFALGVALLTFASLGMGLLISLVSDTERQAVQLSMLVLLLSMFFSGFMLPIEEFRLPLRAIAYLLPVTYGIEIFQQEMLRGGLRATWMLSALALMGGLLFALSALRLRMVLRGV